MAGNNITPVGRKYCSLQEFQERIQKLVDRYEAQFLKKKDRKVNF